jgi:type I restriction enzyme R subunit
VSVEDAFRDPNHPFRVAIVCAMWLTGFDVEPLATLYLDKPMKAHTLMQAIARANRIYPGKECGVIVDYSGMLKSLRQALADYALGDDDAGGAERRRRRAAIWWRRWSRPSRRPSSTCTSSAST